MMTILGLFIPHSSPDLISTKDTHRQAECRQLVLPHENLKVLS